MGPSHSDERWSLRTLQHQDSPDPRLVTSPVTRCGPTAGPTTGSMVWLSASCSLVVFHFRERPLQLESQCCWSENIQQVRVSFIVCKYTSQKSKWGRGLQAPKGKEGEGHGLGAADSDAVAQSFHVV